MAKTKQGTDMVEGVGGLSGDMFDAAADFDFGEIGLEGLDLDLAAFGRVSP